MLSYSKVMALLGNHLQLLQALKAYKGNSKTLFRAVDRNLR